MTFSLFGIILLKVKTIAYACSGRLFEADWSIE